jgi:hypothetical protein
MAAEITSEIKFPALQDPRFPVHKTARLLEPYLLDIVENIHPVKIILFGSQAYGEPMMHSDYALLEVRKRIVSEKQSNLRIRRAFREIRPPLPFAILSKTPEQTLNRQMVPNPMYEEIIGKGLEVYAAPED